MDEKVEKYDKSYSLAIAATQDQRHFIIRNNTLTHNNEL